MPIISTDTIVASGDAFTVASTEPVFVLEETGTIVNVGTGGFDTGIEVVDEATEFEARFVINGSIISSNGISFQDNGGRVTVGKTGIIEAIRFGIVAFAVDTVPLDVFNYGSITAQDDSGISLNAAGNRVVNTGVITSYTNDGNDGAIETRDGADTVFNTGIIIGQVLLGPGADMFDGRGGTANGVIDGGPGTDTFFIDDPAGSIDGGPDNDTVFARSDILDVVNVETITLQGS